jgi:hypothetical protein
MMFLIVGSAWVMRRSSVMRLSSIGTLKSTRIRTRFPAHIDVGNGFLGHDSRCYWHERQDAKTPRRKTRPVTLAAWCHGVPLIAFC